MKFVNITACHCHTQHSVFTRYTNAVIFVAFFLLNMPSPSFAQYTRPAWWFGAAGGANFNFHRGSTQQLNAGVRPPVAFQGGDGVGLFLAPLIAFNKPDAYWGVSLTAAYDSRKTSFTQVTTPCNCPANLSTNLSYITIEPTIRFAPFRGNFFLFGGPRVAFNLDKSFTYQQGVNPLYPDQEATPAVTGDFSEVHKALISMQIGAAFDIWLTSSNNQIQTVFSPFISFQPYFGQSPRAIETWNITTVRLGAALKFGRGHKTIVPEVFNSVVKTPEVQFTVVSPKNITVQRRVRETFPLRNYVFFDLGSTEIPDRYVTLQKNQVREFKEDQLEVFTPKKLSGRAQRGMTVYYNILNILGDRMGKNPAATITLVGSSEKGADDGYAMAASIRRYLVDIFGINVSRIKLEGLDRPKSPSEQPGGTKELDKLREGDRRVSIESTTPAMLMEFQSGPDAPLKPVQIEEVKVAPLDSYLTFNVAGATKAFTSWSLDIRDETGRTKYFGPYTRENVRIPGKAILGDRSEGDYSITMIGETNDRKIVKKTTSAHMVLWTPPENEQGLRYSVIFGFNESKPIDIYEKYLSEIVAQNIPNGAKVLIHGYTDVIGDESNNQRLSMSRALAVQKILEKSLTKYRRTNVTFEVYGFGEDETLSPFDNQYPEERFYNRTVIIDIIK